jgi:hypothetical protein
MSRPEEVAVVKYLVPDGRMLYSSGPDVAESRAGWATEELDDDVAALLDADPDADDTAIQLAQPRAAVERLKASA